MTFARQLRLRKLRPHCEACSGVRGRETIEIDHPPGAEIQWDWFERRRAPWGGTAYVLLGTLPHSGRVRGVLAPSMDQPHLIEGIDGVLRRLGGTARGWRVDRLATVIVPGTRDVQPSFAPVAKFYGVTIDPCPPRRGNRKGSVEASVRYVTGRWWKTMTATTPEEAQRSLDRFCATTAEARVRPVPPSALEAVRQAMARGEIVRPLGPGVGADGRLWRPTVRELADAEPLLALPAVPYPAVVEDVAPVGPNATVAFRGNRYSVPPGLAGVELTFRHRLGTGTVEIHSPAGVLLVSHRLAPAGAGMIVRTPEHQAALERVVLSAFTTAPPCDRKGNSPPGPAALAEAAKLLGREGAEVVVDLAAYQAITEGGRA
ncbi:MAG: Mu transposase domain-containing protein [Acidimicrobiia bacterium]